MGRPTPYYQRENVTLYCGNCADILPHIGPVDLTVTSPPYDALREYNGYEFDFERIARELYRVTVNRGVVVWVVADQTVDGSETLTSFRQALYFKGLGFNVETMIYQIKSTGAKGSNYYYWQAFEYMFVFAKGNPKTSNRIADVVNTRAGTRVGFFPKAERLQSRVGRANAYCPDYSVRPNVWPYITGKNDRTEHPAPFPEALAFDHIRTWANPGDIVLDPMMGSNTTGKMALQYGCRYIGIDISEEYCKIAVERIAQQMLL